MCSEGHILKEKKRVTRLEYMCILGNKIECISTLKKRLSRRFKERSSLGQNGIICHIWNCEVCRLGRMCLSHRRVKFPGRPKVRLIEQQPAEKYIFR